MIALGLLVAVLLADVLAAWKGTGRNRGRVTQQHVEPRQPFDD